MKQFKLSRQPPGPTLTRFFVYDGDDIIGSVNVANEDATALEKHWIGATQPKAVAPRRSSALAEALAAKRQPGSHPPASNKEQNPMVAAMVRAAKRHPLNQQAVLRGC
jgi:hypothetical protein